MSADRGFAVRRLTSAEAAERLDRLRAIFRDAITVAAPACYDAAQVHAWASGADDPELWERRARTSVFSIATHGADFVGVGSLDPLEYVDLLYVDPAWQRHGIASALLAALEEEARRGQVEMLTTNASLLAHPVFSRRGWQVVAWEDVARRGQIFRRARMQKALA